MRKIKAKYGPNFGLTFSLSQRPFQFSSDAYAYRYNGSYLPVIHALRDDISTLGLSNTDTLDSTGAPVAQDTSDYWVALADKPLGGFMAAGIPFPPFDASKVALNAALWNPTSDDTPRARLEKGLDCITKDTGCAAVRINGGPFPALLGVSAYYIQADEQVGGPFRTVMRPYFDALAASSPSTTPATTTNSTGLYVTTQGGPFAHKSWQVHHHPHLPSIQAVPCLQVPHRQPRPTDHMQTSAPNSSPLSSCRSSSCWSQPSFWASLCGSTADRIVLILGSERSIHR